MKKLIYLFLMFFVLNVNAKETAVQQPFLSLTDSQGVGLEMDKLQMRSVLDGITAFTEIEMHFYNPQDRVIEGRFNIMLPSNASISRFAMEINDRWMEGEIVEKQKARRAFEDFLHRRQDPALLEQDAGNMFSARVFPIPAKGVKKLIVSYSELLVNNEGKYTVPLSSLPKIKDLSLKILYKDKDKPGAGFSSSYGTSTATNWKVVSFENKDFKPKEDYILTLPQIKNKETIALKAGEIFAVKLHPYAFANAPAKESYKNVVVLIDASVSQMPDFAGNIDYLQKVLAKIQGKVSVYSFNQETETVDGLDKLKNFKPLGATNLEKALEKISADVKTAGTRLLVVSDGVATAGETDYVKLVQIIAANKNIERTDVLTLTSYKNEKFLKALSAASKNAGVVINKNINETAAAAKLTQSTVKTVLFAVDGAQWFWPENAAGLQQNDEVVVFAQAKEGKTPSLTVNGKTVSFKTEPADKHLLKREWVRARIDKLLDMESKTEDKDLKGALNKQIIEVSEKERVLSPYTAMLVLETENDYRRYNIDRNALADIMTVGPDGIVMVERKPEDIAVPVIPEPEPVRPVPVPLPRPFSRETQKSMAVPAEALSVNEALSAERVDFSFDEEISASDSFGNADFAAPASAARQRSAQSEVQRSAVSESRPATPSRPRLAEQAAGEPDQKSDKTNSLPKTDPLAGKFKEFSQLLKSGKSSEGIDFALKWIAEEPDNMLAFIALGDAYAAKNNAKQAALAYGSIIDMYPGRVDMRRFAAQKLLTLNYGAATLLAIDSLTKALADRPDHQTTYLLLSVAHYQNGDKIKAIDVLVNALNSNKTFVRNNSRNVFEEQIGLIASTLSDKEKDDKIKDIVRKFKLNTSIKPQMRFLLTWETDANDVDLHVYDKDYYHSYYSSKNLKSGGRLYADITNGYGPECFAMEDPTAFPYYVYANYYNMGPMGYGMGSVTIVRYYKNNSLNLEVVPFVIMKNRSYIDIAKVTKF